MCRVIIPEQIRLLFDTAYKLSSTFKESVDAVLKHGAITYILVDDDKSFYDGPQRTIALGVRTGGDDVARMPLKNRLESDVIFEFMNAYFEDVEPLPSIGKFSSATDYGRAREYSEWKGVQRHYKIMNELQAVDPNWALLNRFAGGFETLNVNATWNNFENYYNVQFQSGHTQLYHNEYEEINHAATALLSLKHGVW